ncbi:hypothetical protein [Evansella cellulosilytica]|uniref:Uncharacterized protein n=1 Tax=Evansella cellulosilytica (strain ATCC 21833 / DSM 2522 / FERM P-1141 / JCM 9156 / N-4) TaxID=649639 RepID=E6TWF2_EVAC2|nr:hypothetical protein [Evansella cellulosilytica]ADU32215.1 hypothetical protein Bcell_3983 [Evansella cellulosilytica DSM 2522]
MLYVTIVTILLAIFVWFLPKRLRRNDVLVIWITVSYVEIVADLILGLLLDLYYFAGENEVSAEALGIKLIMAPLFGIIFLHYMPKDFRRFIPYWLFWAVFSTFFEWTTSVFHYLTYTGWTPFYSFIFFLIIIPLFRVYYLYIKH